MTSWDVDFDIREPDELRGHAVVIACGTPREMRPRRRPRSAVRLQLNDGGPPVSSA